MFNRCLTCPNVTENGNSQCFKCSSMNRPCAGSCGGRIDKCEPSWKRYCLKCYYERKQNRSIKFLN